MTRPIITGERDRFKQRYAPGGSTGRQEKQTRTKRQGETEAAPASDTVSLFLYGLIPIRDGLASSQLK